MNLAKPFLCESPREGGANRLKEQFVPIRSQQPGKNVDEMILARNLTVLLGKMAIEKPANHRSERRIRTLRERGFHGLLAPSQFSCRGRNCTGSSQGEK